MRVLRDSVRRHGFLFSLFGGADVQVTAVPNSLKDSRRSSTIASILEASSGSVPLAHGRPHISAEICGSFSSQKANQRPLFQRTRQVFSHQHAVRRLILLSWPLVTVVGHAFAYQNERVLRTNTKLFAAVCGLRHGGFCSLGTLASPCMVCTCFSPVTKFERCWAFQNYLADSNSNCGSAGIIQSTVGILHCSRVLYRKMSDADAFLVEGKVLKTSEEVQYPLKTILESKKERDTISTLGLYPILREVVLSKH